jgi:hypothetical protein
LVDDGERGAVGVRQDSVVPGCQHLCC